MKTSLSQHEAYRYARHISLPGFGYEGQCLLKSAHVLIIGAGGLGSPIALYLAAAGVGHITVADGDSVELHNLQRQVIHRIADVARPKAISAAEKMRALNDQITVTPLHEFLTHERLREIAPTFDFIIEATDSLHTKFMVDDVCTELKIPYNHGAIFQYEGQTMTVLPGTASLRTLFPDGPDAVKRTPPAGPLGIVPGILGPIQAAEAVKHITHTGTLLTDRLLRFDIRTMDFYTIRLR